MRRWMMAGAVLSLAAAPALGAVHRELHSSYATEGLDDLHLDLPVAEVRFEGHEGREIAVDLFLECRRPAGPDCERALAALRLGERRRARTLHLKLEGYPRWSQGKIEIEARVRLPETLGLELEMGVGEVDVEGLSGDLRLEIGVGEVNLWLDRRTLRSVSLESGVGEVELHGVESRQPRRRRFVGSELSWFAGAGEARVRVEVGVGEVSAWVVD